MGEVRLPVLQRPRGTGHRGDAAQLVGVGAEDRVVRRPEQGAAHERLRGAATDAQGHRSAGLAVAPDGHVLERSQARRQCDDLAPAGDAQARVVAAPAQVDLAVAGRGVAGGPAVVVDQRRDPRRPHGVAAAVVDVGARGRLGDRPEQQVGPHRVVRQRTLVDLRGPRDVAGGVVRVRVLVRPVALRGGRRLRHGVPAGRRRLVRDPRRPGQPGVRVEFHLGQIYGKLGVRSRTQLAAALAAGAGSAITGDQPDQRTATS